jgi:predicted metal-dependent peptidase
MVTFLHLVLSPSLRFLGCFALRGMLRELARVISLSSDNLEFTFYFYTYLDVLSLCCLHETDALLHHVVSHLIIRHSEGRGNSMRLAAFDLLLAP